MTKQDYFTNIDESFVALKYIKGNARTNKDIDDQDVESFESILYNKSFLRLMEDYWIYYVLNGLFLIASYMFSLKHLLIYVCTYLILAGFSLYKIESGVMSKIFFLPAISLLYLHYQLINLTASDKSEFVGSYIFNDLSENIDSKRKREFFSIFKISQFSFIVRRYRTILILLLILTFIVFMRSPILVSVGLLSVYYLLHKYDVYDSVTKIDRVYRLIVFLMITGAIAGLLILVFLGGLYVARDLVESFFYLLLIIFLGHIILSLISKYKEVYVIGAKNLDDAATSKFYIWKDEHGEKDGLY
ncbi:MAG: Unknown protein [uncultured Sulfurovum sp.]|uniref:Uncharacterized protein n=1 Tax=uncultured Sulfurovum sp. TaxID=269237 RepID=A0A6S6SDF4_9BACT|nr:MAG: Unknown protein [uncultured Sulfurovum sp.]